MGQSSLPPHSIRLDTFDSIFGLFFNASIIIPSGSGIREPLCELASEHLDTLKEAMTIGKVKF